MMGQGTIRTVDLENRVICYTLEQKEVKNLNLRIRKNGNVYVSANPSVPVEKVDEFVAGKADYIGKAQEQFRKIAEYAPKPKQYISGESFYILGRDLRLKVEQTGKNAIHSDGVYLYLEIQDTNDYEKKKRMVTKYLDQKCREIFGEIIEETYPVFQKYGVARPELRIRAMETRWGSCLPKKGVITLNKQLLEAPRNCVEYVVMHEFCHFIHPDHSKRFYAFLAMLMPDWKERKIALEKLAEYGL